MSILGRNVTSRELIGASPIGPYLLVLFCMFHIPYSFVILLRVLNGAVLLVIGFTSPVDPASTTSDPLNTRAYLGDSFEDFSAEDALRLGLDPLASEELEMLEDPSVITDAATEDMFRLDQDYWKPS